MLRPGSWGHGPVLSVHGAVHIALQVVAPCLQMPCAGGLAAGIAKRVLDASLQPDASSLMPNLTRLLRWAVFLLTS